MKKLITLLFILISFSVYSQREKVLNGDYRATDRWIWTDSDINMTGLSGTGDVITINSAGRLQRGSSLGSTTIGIDSVINLRPILDELEADKQDTFVVLECLQWNATKDTLSIDSACQAAFIQNIIDSSGGVTSVTAGTGLGLRGGGSDPDTIFISNAPQDSILGLIDSLAAKQSSLVAGTNITISGDTISSTGSGQWTRSGNYVYVTNPDSVGIGTATPQRGLDVNQSTRIQLLNSATSLEVNNLSSGTALSITSSTGSALELNGYGVSSISNDTTLADEDSTALVTEYAVRKAQFFETENDTAIKVKSGVNAISIGADGNGFQFRSFADRNRVYNDTTILSEAGGIPFPERQVNLVNFYEADSQAIAIQMSSRWGANSAISEVTSFTVANEESALAFKTEEDDGGGGDNYMIERFRLTKEGAAIPNGVGFTATQRLDVDGNARFRNIGSNASAGALHYDANGVLTTNTSDSTLKKNIQPIQNALELVLQLQGVTYQWKDSTASQEPKIGLIAQEVEAVVPEASFTNPRTNIMGVHYADLVALLIEAIKEQQAQIEALKNQ